MDNLNITLITKIVGDVFKEDDNISVIFLSENIFKDKRYSSKANIGNIIKIKNWHEIVVKDESSREGVVYANINDLIRNDIIKYCTKIYQGHNEAYISFYNDKSLLYVNSDVIDIILKDVGKIADLKQKYSIQFDEYYDNGDPF
ncbi:hypothetical protein ABE28_001675 [Peribacillus muralis]|uniref:Uncharacterized protein n=2 Tax=Peribacillus muralis TaxID=264697 RepID=A0A1B3XIN7_9BACI|nr:hypothetical protein ABE28_001675 [Peribacillus muralis]